MSKILNRLVRASKVAKVRKQQRVSPPTDGQAVNQRRLDRRMGKAVDRVQKAVDKYDREHGDGGHSIAKKHMSESFLKSVKHSTTDGPDHRYNFDHKGKNVEIDIEKMKSGKQQVDFSHGGRMTRMGGDKTRGTELYRKIGKVIRAHDKLKRGTKDGYDFSTIHEPSMNPELGGRSGTRPRVTGKLLKRLSSKMGKKYSSAEGSPTGHGQRRTIHTVSENTHKTFKQYISEINK